MSTTYHYEVVPGFFVYDSLDGERPLTEPVVPPRMGLIDKSKNRWDKFRKKIFALNQELRTHDAEVKVFFFVRHGQAWHNVAQSKYGRERWIGGMGRKNGDGEITRGHPELTPIGINQAIEVKRGWEAELPFRITLPERLYSSPWTRALHTTQIMFEGIILGDVEDRRTVVVQENCRGRTGVYTSGKRRTRSYIHERFPDYEFEEGFEEEDRVWDPEVRETKGQVSERARRVLDYIFEEDTSSIYISITTHDGTINGFLQVMDRDPFRLPTGGVIPVVIKCQRK